MSRDLVRSRLQKVMPLFVTDPIKPVQTLANLVTISICSGEDVIVWFFHWISQDHVTKGSCHIICGRSSMKCPSFQVWWPIDRGSGVLTDLVCHMISQEHRMKGSHYFMSGSPSRKREMRLRKISTDSY